MEQIAAILQMLQIVISVLALFGIVVMWKIFSKAGEPGWACLIPIYNSCVWFKVAGKPMWWILLMLIPIVNLVILIIATVGLANKFGKGGGFAAGLILLPIIFYPILAFGSAEYQN